MHGRVQMYHLEMESEIERSLRETREKERFAADGHVAHTDWYTRVRTQVRVNARVGSPRLGDSRGLSDAQDSGSQRDHERDPVRAPLRARLLAFTFSATR